MKRFIVFVLALLIVALAGIQLLAQEKPKEAKKQLAKESQNVDVDTLSAWINRKMLINFYRQEINRRQQEVANKQQEIIEIAGRVALLEEMLDDSIRVKK